MSGWTIVAVVAYSASALGFLAFAASFGLRAEWEAWHAEAAGQPFSELGRGVQVVVLAIMRAAAAGGLALAVITTLLVVQLARDESFARVALPVVTLTFAIPAAAVAVRFRRTTAANPPLGPAVAGVVTPIIGLVASLL